MRRRTYLTSVTATALGLSIAGCVGDGDGGAPGDDGEPSDDEPDEDHEGDEPTDGDSDDESTEDDEDESEEVPELVGTFDDFEDLDRWGVIAGTLEADGGTAFEGTQSARLLASESEPQVRVARTLDEPIDVGEVVPGLAVSTSRRANVVIQLQNDDGDYLQYQQLINESEPFLRQNFGHTAVSGDPDPSEITEIHVVCWAGDENEAELWVDDLHFVRRVEPGRVMIQFQGGFESDYTHAFPILEAHDLVGSTFVATDRIRPSAEASGNRLTRDQLAELVDAGWSLGTVGARHQQLHRVDSDEVDAHILDPLEWFDDHGYDDARYFAFPGGRYDQRMYDLVREHYHLGYAARFRSQGWASNPYTLTRISGDVGQRNLTAEEMIGALDWTAEHGGITTIVFYEMDDDDVAALEETAPHLASLLSAGELELITPREIADDYVH